MTMPMSLSRLTAYPDQPTETVAEARPYSRNSSSPMIHAAPSPMEA